MQTYFKATLVFSLATNYSVYLPPHAKHKHSFSKPPKFYLVQHQAQARDPGSCNLNQIQVQIRLFGYISSLGIAP